MGIVESLTPSSITLRNPTSTSEKIKHLVFNGRQYVIGQFETAISNPLVELKRIRPISLYREINHHSKPEDYFEYIVEDQVETVPLHIFKGFCPCSENLVLENLLLQRHPYINDVFELMQTYIDRAKPVCLKFSDPIITKRIVSSLVSDPIETDADEIIEKYKLTIVSLINELADVYKSKAEADILLYTLNKLLENPHLSKEYGEINKIQNRIKTLQEQLYNTSSDYNELMIEHQKALDLIKTLEKRNLELEVEQTKHFDSE